MKRLAALWFAVFVSWLAVAHAAPSLRERSVFVEGEDFTPTGPGWEAGDGWQDDIYSATSGNAVIGNFADNHGEATKDIVVPEAGTFAVWVRYLKIGNYPGTFGLRIAQGGKTIFDQQYRTKHEGRAWTPVWEKFATPLQAGPATLTLYIAVPGIRQKVDCILITPDLNYQPDYRDFAPRTFVRFRLLAPSSPVQADLSVYLKRPPVFYHEAGWVTATGLGARGPLIAPGDWSPWVDVSKFMDGGQWQATAKFAFRSTDAPFAHLKVDWQVSPDADARNAKNLHDDVEGDISTLILPGDMTRFPEVVALASMLSRQHFEEATALGLPPIADTTIPLETSISGWDSAFRSKRVLGWEMGAAHAVGLNVFNELIGPRNVVASSVGVRRGYLGHFFPAQILNCPTAKTNEKTADDYFRARARAMLQGDPDALHRHYRNVLYDEIGTSSIPHIASCSSCLAGFVSYLKERGLKPVDLARGGWDDVKPIARELAVDTKTRRLHYWSVQYRDYTNAMLVKMASESCRRSYGASMLTMVNFTDEPISGWTAPISGPDWFLYGRLASTTGLWSEDYASYGPEVSGLIVDTLRGAARPNHLPVGMYLVAHTPSLAQRTWSALMHGATMLHFYTWGPYYAFNDGKISQSSTVELAVGRATRAVAAVDPFVARSSGPRAQVAIFRGKSQAIWEHDSAAEGERRAAYLACAQSHAPVDLLSEEDVVDGLLKDYRLLFLVETNVPHRVADKIAAWVRAGGVLQMSPGAGTRDDLDDPATTLPDLAGIAVTAVERPGADYREHHGIPHIAPRGSVHLPATRYWREATFPVIGYRETSIPRGATVLGTFSDGKPAAYMRHAGQGIVLRFSFMPGLGYWKSATSVPPAATITGYDRGQLEVLAAGLQLAHVVTPLEVSDPMVEAQLLHGPDADVVMLANWSGQPIPQLRVTIRGAAHAANVSASQGATLDVVHSGEDLLVTVPIDDVEAVVLRR